MTLVLAILLCFGGVLSTEARTNVVQKAKDFGDLMQAIESRCTNCVTRDKDGAVLRILAGFVNDDQLVQISREPSIRELSFVGPPKEVTERGMTALEHMTNLLSLQIARNNFMPRVSKMSQLRRLNTWCSRLKPPDLAYLIKMTNLEDLVIRGDWEMGSNAVSAMTNLTRLKRLVLGGGGDEGSCAHWISEFQREGHENGTNWDGWHYPKTDEFKALTNLTSLEELQIWSFTMFGDEQLRDLRQLPNLKSLKLYDTQVSDNWSNIVRQFPSLTNAERSVFDPRLHQEWSRVR